MEENKPAKKYSFFTPQIPQGGGFTPNFPLGLGDVDFGNIKKNIPHFTELAESFGLGLAKGQILKNTMSLVTTERMANRWYNNPSLKKDNRSATILQNEKPKLDNYDVQFESPLKALNINDPASLGFKVYSDLSITGSKYFENDGKTVKGTYDDIHAPVVIFELSRENNVIVTDIQGRDNSIIEYISGKSWKINCKGRIMSARNAIDTYPRTLVDNLIAALNSNKSLQVTSWFLNMCGIYNIVIQKKTIPQEEGSMEWQKFEFDAIADYPVILRRPK